MQSVRSVFGKSFITKFLLSLMITVAFILTLFVVTTNAQVQLPLTVTTTTDDGVGSLRNAVRLANVATSNDTITFNIPANDAGCVNGVCTITLTSGDLSISDAAMYGTLTINGSGANVLRVSGSNLNRIFYLDSGSNLTFSGLTLTNGNGNGSSFGRLGGAVCNFGTLTISNSVITNSTAIDNGGGIYNESGTVKITNSTISNNSVIAAQSFGGGGIFTNFGTFELTNSTVNNNSALQFGGGIFLINGAVTISNSTISGNMANGQGAGGGIDNTNATLTVTASTIANNKSTFDSSDNGGGIRISATVGTSNTNIRDTIIAGNNATNASAAPDIKLVFGTFTSNGYNLIGDASNTGNALSFQTTDVINKNAKLDVLANNGGATQTHRLLGGSPAIDKGNAFGLTTDERGTTRPIDNPSVTNASDGSDIGAFEAASNVTTAASVSVSGKVLTSKGRGIVNAIVSITDANGNTRSTKTSAFGRYNFDNVATGGLFIFSANSKRYSFNESSVIRSITEESDDVNFIASE